MKLNKFIVGFAALAALTFSNCYKNFDDLETNPNRATTAPPGIVLNGIEWDFNRAHGQPWGTRDASNEQRWNQFYCTNYNYYGTNEYSWASFDLNYGTLKNVVKMEEEAIRTGADAQNPYAALGKFFRAFFFVNMTQRLGDLPMSEALKGLENPTPKYDSQKEIYKQALAWLDEANDGLAAARGSLDGDFYYGGDLVKWQKAVNSYQLRVLISLSKKEADADLNIKTRFANILSNPSKYPVFAGMSDNLQFVYNSAANKYPINPDVFGFDDGRVNHSEAFLGQLDFAERPARFCGRRASRFVDSQRLFADSI